MSTMLYVNDDDSNLPSVLCRCSATTVNLVTIEIACNKKTKRRIVDIIIAEPILPILSDIYKSQ